MLIGYPEGKGIALAAVLCCLLGLLIGQGAKMPCSTHLTCRNWWTNSQRFLLLRKEGINHCKCHCEESEIAGWAREKNAHCRNACGWLILLFTLQVFLTDSFRPSHQKKAIIFEVCIHTRFCSSDFTSHNNLFTFRETKDCLMVLWSLQSESIGKALIENCLPSSLGLRVYA